jgi:hypothetical protein
VNRVNTDAVPPAAFVCGTMRFSVVRTAKWDSEFIADLQP